MDRTKLLFVIFLFAFHQCTLTIEANHQHQKSHVVSQLKREVKRLREKDEALERRVQEMSEKDEALEEEVKHLRKDVEEQLMSVAKFLPSPCQHGKPFYENHFKCQCHQGWTGDKCQLDIDECQGNNPCKNGGTCTNLQGNYTCDCSNTGYRGRQCEEFMNRCSDGLCQNGGVCTSQLEGYHCECSSGYTGKNCQLIEDPILDAQLDITGRDVNKRGYLNKTALHIATEKDLLKAAKWLIKEGADLEAQDKNNNTALHLAARKHSLRVATLLVEEGADVSAKGYYGRTPLHETGYHDSINVAKLLLNKSRDLIMARDDENNTPLHGAARLDRLRVATLLVEEGANVSVKGYDGRIPLHWAAKRDSINVAKLLLNKSKSSDEVNARDNNDNTPLHFAARFEDSLRVATLLVEEGADVSLKNEYGKTPLHEAAIYDAINVAKLLLNKSRDEMNARDNNNDTPLHLAAGGPQTWRDSLRVATLLVEEGADVSLKGEYGRTPLHLAAYYNSIKVAKLLLDKSCDEMKARDNSNKTPLTLAKSQNAEKVLQLFQTVCVVN